MLREDDTRTPQSCPATASKLPCHGLTASATCLWLLGSEFFEGAQVGIGRDLSFRAAFWSQRGLVEAHIARHEGHFADLEDSGVFLRYVTNLSFLHNLGGG